MRIGYLLFMTCIVTNLSAGERLQEPQLNTKKIYLIEQSFAHLDSVNEAPSEKKSAIRAALYSAVLPGAGEYYAGSFWKAALFAGIEVAAWTTHFIYDSKGNDQDVVMRSYADDKWDERKYWSWLYYKGGQREDIRNLAEFPDYQTAPDENGNPILTEYNQDVINSLRFLEDELNHTHSLPHTKTQQYYEMIYKYLGQFGNAWEDAPNFDISYDGGLDQLTPQMQEYRRMRNRMNDFYDIATTATNVVLLNHILSAIDAAWTVHAYNRSLHINLQVHNRKYFDEQVQMYGIHLAW